MCIVSGEIAEPGSWKSFSGRELVYKQIIPRYTAAYRRCLCLSLGDADHIDQRLLVVGCLRAAAAARLGFFSLPSSVCPSVSKLTIGETIPPNGHQWLES